MKKYALTLLSVLVLSSCRGSSAGNQPLESGSTNGTGTTVVSQTSFEFTTTFDIKEALDAGGLPCTGYKVVARDKREMGLENAVEVAECVVQGESVQLVVWKDNGQRDNFNGMTETYFCKISKSFGIKSIDWVDGDKWQILPTSMTLAKQIEDRLKANARHKDC